MSLLQVPMRILPFNQSELESIKKPLIANGWRENDHVVLEGNACKFFIYKHGRIANLTLEYPIPIPFTTRSYFNLGRVKYSIFASLGMIREEYLVKLFLYWSKKLPEIIPVISQVLNEKKVLDLKTSKDQQNEISGQFIARLPEPSASKDEKFYLQRLRLNLSREKSNLDYGTCKHLGAVFKEMNLVPTQNFSDNIELADGLAPALMDRLLVFKNPDYSEKIFLEPGFFTYYRDIEIENVRFRAYFDTFAIEPLIKYWNVDIENFFSEMLKAVRLSFTSFLDLTGVSEFTKVYFFQKNLDLAVKQYLASYPKDAQDPDFKEIVFPIPNPWFENVMAGNSLRYPSWNLFIKAPETFDELQARKVYLDGQKQTKQGDFSETIAAYSKILAIFNKSGQKYGFFLTLLELARIAVKVGKYDEVKKKYNLLIEFAKKNESIISPDEFTMIQEEFAEAHLKFDNKDNAIRQITLLYNYLERARPESDTKRIDMLLKLNEVFIERDDFMSIDSEIQDYFKKIKNFAEKHKNKMILARYHLILARYYVKRGKISSALSSLKRGLSDAQSLNLVKEEVAILIEISKIHLYGKKKDLSQAERYLEAANERVGKTDDLVKELRVYEMLHDLYRQQDNYELASFYDKQSSKLRVALRARGIL
ncbi:hypothetical protein GF325_00520 [Candidatus Bathyarchaeota archaeon]|nr:hypothetical protein [Candidatus Bathyarchaeota archaeon]